MNQDGDCLTICYTEGETNKMNVWSIDRSLKFNQFNCNFSTFFCAGEPIFQKLHDIHFIDFCRWRSFDIWAAQILFFSRLVCLIHTTMVQPITFTSRQPVRMALCSSRNFNIFVILKNVTLQYCVRTITPDCWTTFSIIWNVTCLNRDNYLFGYWQ